MSQYPRESQIGHLSTHEAKKVMGYKEPDKLWNMDYKEPNKLQNMDYK